MRTEIKTITVPLYDFQFDETGEAISQTCTGYTEVMITDVFADDGKVLAEKATGKIMSNHITLGEGDCAENYCETIV